jgi:hypothetical protein
MTTAFTVPLNYFRDQTIANKEACDATFKNFNPFSIRNTRCGACSSN